ncbi:hypothetical protein SAMN02745216_04335 [Desulfatibacillum alkenivorans DSM 16219]|jgi:hypothetical protein|uniref:SMP-30/Gluconolactonase/LRE-like region domain-containing protein n=1 Tax=Desulfatibacillum alkenivorans DSM 16219 TaxID=1121393 RepID=A0A1M6WHV1_9BACT|nr:hypothetical protein [Desulfatibacillum alkenivorans]SHK93330.1 hypothetical protein SAMN02745216_04335 [Desulfatibacillum alkenivorans DSM 16219]
MKRLLLFTIAAMCIMSLSAPAFAASPLLPFAATGDLWVLDDNSGCVFAITPEQEVSVVIEPGDVISATGWTYFDFYDTGIAFDAAGAAYFAAKSDGLEYEESVIFKYENGALSILADSAAIMAVTNDPDGYCSIKGLAFGSDGALYANDDASEQVIKVCPETGDVSLFASNADLRAAATNNGVDESWVDLNSGIIGGPGGVIYTATDDSMNWEYPITGGVITYTSVNTIFSLGSAISPTVLVTEAPPYDSGNPFSDLDAFMTRGPDGFLYISDDSGAQDILRVDPDTGDVSVFLTEEVISQTMGMGYGPDLEGGIAFDGSGNFYVAEQNSGTILKFSQNRKSWSGVVWVAMSVFETLTGEEPVFDGGIAFVPVKVEEDEPEFIFHNNDGPLFCFVQTAGEKAASGGAAPMAFAVLLVLAAGLWLGLGNRK